MSNITTFFYNISTIFIFPTITPLRNVVLLLTLTDSTMITFSLRFNLPSSLVSCAAGGDASLLDQKSIELKISNRQTDEEIGNITLDFGPPSPEVSPLSSSCNRLKNSSGEFMEKKFKESITGFILA